MRCPKCGTENPDGAQLCRSCSWVLTSTATQAPSAGTKTSGMAIAALVLGILSPFTCFITAIPAIILGIVALVKISKSAGQLKGNGFAIAGIALPVVLLPFFTLLIWVWAVLALDERLSVSSVAISVARSTNPSLWVSFNDDESSVSIANIVLKGPASRIGNARRKLNDGSLVLEFFLVAEQQGLTDPGEYSLDVLAFLKKSGKIRDLGLTVESCDPNTLSVNVVELVKRRLTVKCFDEDQNLIKGAIIEPPQVDIFVRQDWVGDAKVQLTRREIEQVRLSAIVKKPYIELAPDQIREAAKTVDITAPPEEDRLSDYTITAATLGFTLSPTLLGEYDVEVENLPDVIGGITIRATPEAKRAYEKMRYQVILEIYDEDARSTEPLLKKELIYNFPAEYVRKDEIMLNQQPVFARFKLFKLKLLPSAETPEAAGH